MMVSFVDGIVDPPAPVTWRGQTDMTPYVQSACRIPRGMPVWQARETAMLNLLIFCKGRKLTDVTFEEYNCDWL